MVKKTLMPCRGRSRSKRLGGIWVARRRVVRGPCIALPIGAIVPESRGGRHDQDFDFGCVDFLHRDHGDRGG